MFSFCVHHASFYTSLECSVYFTSSYHIMHCMSITYLCIHTLYHAVYILAMHLASCLFLMKSIHVISMHHAHSHLYFVSCIYYVHTKSLHCDIMLYCLTHSSTLSC